MKNKRNLKVIKLVVTLLVVLVLLVAGGFVKRTPLAERSIIVGIGLDKTEEGIKLLAQCVVGGESTTPGAASSYLVLDGKGATITQALEDLSKHTGTTPSYAHCNILFVGKDFLEDGFDDTAKVLFVKGLLQDNTQVLAVESAEDAITANVPILNTPSEYMSHEIKLASENGGRSLVNLKDYVQRISPLSGTRYLTLAKKVPAHSPTGSGANTGKSSFLFDLSNTAVFDYQNTVHYYGKEVTEGVGLIEAKGGGIVTAEENGKHVIVSIDASLKKRSYSKNPPQIEGEYTYFVKLVEQNMEENVAELDIEKVRELLSNTIRNKIEYSYNTCLADGVDIFSIKSRLYKRFGEEMKDIPLSEIKWNIKVNVVMK